MEHEKLIELFEGRKFQAVEGPCIYTCKWMVLPEDSDASLCYCTDETRAELISEALTRLHEQPQLKQRIEVLERDLKALPDRQKKLDEVIQAVTGYTDALKERDDRIAQLKRLLGKAMSYVGYVEDQDQFIKEVNEAVL